MEQNNAGIDRLLRQRRTLRSYIAKTGYQIQSLEGEIKALKVHRKELRARLKDQEKTYDKTYRK